MKKLNDKNDIWILEPTVEDLTAGADYASITLPWTFNRMMLNTGSKGQKSRALNIAKGIIGQEMLNRELAKRTIQAELERKSHRDTDMYDLSILIQGNETKLDLKSINFFTDYASLGRLPLSAELIIENAAYPGPDWRRFFPMLIPHTQIVQSKEAYCFAIASSIDLRNDIDTNRIGHALTAFPFGEMLGFASSKKLCLAREEAGKGFYITCSYSAKSLFDSPISLKVLGEWKESRQEILIKLSPGKVARNIGPFSCVSSFQIDREDYDKLYGEIEISISRNDYDAVVFNTSRVNVNSPPGEVLTISRADFCNLMLPTDYTLYVIGWIFKDEFLELCKNYSGWVWPYDKVNKFENMPWSQITEKDLKSITKAGFEGTLQNNPRLLKAGWMKTNGRGGGSCCYVFPNIGQNGGVKETNLFILPQDLYTMDSLIE